MECPKCKSKRFVKNGIVPHPEGSIPLRPEGPRDSFVRPEGIPSPKGCPWHGKGLPWTFGRDWHGKVKHALGNMKYAISPVKY